MYHSEISFNSGFLGVSTADILTWIILCGAGCSAWGGAPGTAGCPWTSRRRPLFGTVDRALWVGVTWSSWGRWCPWDGSSGSPSAVEIVAAFRTQAGSCTAAVFTPRERSAEQGQPEVLISKILPCLKYGIQMALRENSGVVEGFKLCFYLKNLISKWF